MSRALLLVAHGSARDANGRTSILDHAARIRAMGRFAEVGVGFWKEAPFLPDAIGQFRALDVTVVPVFISAGYYADEVVPRELGLSARLSRIGGRTVRYTPPVGSHASVATILEQRALEAGATAADAVAVYRQPRCSKSHPSNTCRISPGCDPSA